MGLLNTIETYSVLQDSLIEGIEPMTNKFQHIYSTIQKKPYDILDYRKLDFNNDYDDFRRQIDDLNTLFEEFMDSSINRSSSTLHSLKLLSRLSELEIPSLGITQKLTKIFMQFNKEIENIRLLYQKHREEPPIPRDMPPVAGKIAWARQLYRKIQEPMDIFALHPYVFEGVEAKKVVRCYNKVAEVLLKFEMLYHQAWEQSVQACKEALQVPVLVRHYESKEVHVNLDPTVYLVMREAECMRKLDLEIP